MTINAIKQIKVSKIEGKKRNRMKPKEIYFIVLYMLYLYFFSYKF